MNLTTICSVGLAATVLVCGMDVFCAATAKKRLYASDIVWAVLFAGVQAFVFAWSAQGLIEADEGALMLMSVVVLDIACLAAAHLSLSRRAASSRLMLAAAPSDWTAYRVVSVFVALTALAAAAALCVLAVELPHNFALEQVNAKTVFVEWELLYAALVGLYFLGQRHAVLPSLVPVASMGIGVAEHFVFLFKGQPIQPGDMLAIGTAAAVSDGYVYTLSAQCLWGLTAGVAALLVCVVLARFRRRPEHFSDACFSPAHRNAGILANAIAGAAVLACIVSNVTGVDYCSSYGSPSTPGTSWRVTRPRPTSPPSSPPASLCSRQSPRATARTGEKPFFPAMRRPTTRPTTRSASPAASRRRSSPRSARAWSP